MKYYYYVLIALAYIYGAAWLFNHVNAWLGIGFVLLIPTIIFKTIKNKQQ